MSPPEKEKGLAELLSGASPLTGLVPAEREISLFESYRKEILFWNNKMNLVSVKSSLDLPVKHFIDSLTVAPYLPRKDVMVLDIGAGAGFPGIPLKICMGSLKLYLLESQRKKASFLKHIIRKLDLHDVTVIHKRAEGIIGEGSYREFFDTVISRATLKLPKLIVMGGYFLSAGGILIAMKGAGVEKELRDALDLCPSNRMVFLDARDLFLPETADRRKIVIFKKT
jgi:16S rRNA (guanine527-N7)-methyltransferase